MSLKRIGWWIFFGASALYSGYALYMGGLEIGSLLGIVDDAPERAVPLIFAVHAFSFFFVTFSFWVPVLVGTNLPEPIAFPLAVFLSWSLNLLVAELWIRRSRLQAASRLPAMVYERIVSQQM